MITGPRMSQKDLVLSELDEFQGLSVRSEPVVGFHTVGDGRGAVGVRVERVLPDAHVEGVRVDDVRDDDLVPVECRRRDEPEDGRFRGRFRSDFRRSRGEMSMPVSKESSPKQCQSERERGLQRETSTPAKVPARVPSDGSRAGTRRRKKGDVPPTATGTACA